MDFLLLVHSCLQNSSLFELELFVNILVKVVKQSFKDEEFLADNPLFIPDPLFLPEFLLLQKSVAQNPEDLILLPSSSDLH